MLPGKLSPLTMTCFSVRVVDISAFPFVPPGLPQATVCKFQRPEALLTVRETQLMRSLGNADMLAEKIADDIKRGK